LGEKFKGDDVGFELGSKVLGVPRFWVFGFRSAGADVQGFFLAEPPNLEPLNPNPEP
jgi:hypothetical protein